MNINESRDDDERYRLTSTQFCDKMADDNDVMLAAALTIIVAAAVRRRRRRKRSSWVRDWMLRRPQYGTYCNCQNIRLNDQKTYRHFCREDAAEYMMNIGLRVEFD